MLMLVMSFFFIALVFFGLFQLAKGARFNQLNFLHFKYNVQLENVIENRTLHDLDTDKIRQTIKLIREQPVECLEIINPIDLLIMRLLGTAVAYDLCIEDKAVGDKTLLALTRYEHGEIYNSELREILYDAQMKFQRHSEQFEHPIEKTVNFITVFILVIGTFSGVAVGVSLLMISRGISQTVRNMENATTALAESEKNNRKLAHIDSLTNLPNRNLFQDRLEFTIALCKRNKTSFSLLFIDLDRFKYVNDTYGHVAGDSLLKDAAQRLTNALRASDTVARIGGDEFTVIINETDNAYSAASVAEKIVNIMAEPFNVKGLDTFISASIGITTYPTDADSASELLKNADVAMYQAKAKGKNTYEFYSKELYKQTQSRVRWENDIRKAIENESFELHYQPVINMKCMKTIGAEALIRWNHQELGYIAPQQFIGLAEETGLIIPIGEWVLKETLMQSEIWRKNHNSNISTAINVSVEQLKSANFAKSVADMLSLTGATPHTLDIEITESIFLEDETSCLRTLYELSEMGIRLFLDDFGTGYSSFSYLNRLPFDVLKIDRSFVPTFKKEDRQKETIASSIIAMAHALNIKVIAEGVETIECVNYLKSQQCDMAQGYFFDRPLPAAKFEPHRMYQHLLDNEQKQACL